MIPKEEKIKAEIEVIELLKERMEETGLTQHKVAQLLGVAPSTMSELLHGQSKGRTPFDKLVMIVLFCDRNPAWLFQRFGIRARLELWMKDPEIRKHFVHLPSTLDESPLMAQPLELEEEEA